MPTPDLKGIRERMERATPGPWAWAQTAEKGYGANVGAECFAEDDERCERPLSGDLSERRDDFEVGQPIADLWHQLAASDAEFIAHARSDVPDLVREVERLTAENERLRGERYGLRQHLLEAARENPVCGCGHAMSDHAADAPAYVPCAWCDCTDFLSSAPSRDGSP